MVIMIASIHISQEIFATDIVTTLKPSLQYNHKRVLQLLQLHRDQALTLPVRRGGGEGGWDDPKKFFKHNSA